jgi:hypothetical protein
MVDGLQFSVDTQKLTISNEIQIQLLKIEYRK